MDILLHYILPILVCSLIGYCTNYIAIKMLFRPYRAKYIGKKKLPFTPGIIPKNQERVAGAIGGAIEKELLKKEDIVESLSGPAAGYINGFTDEVFESGKSIRELLPKGVEIDDAVDKAVASFAEATVSKIDKESLEEVITEQMEKTFDRRTEAKPILAIVLTKNMADSLSKKMTDSIFSYIGKNGESIISDFAGRYIRETLERPVNDIISDDEERAGIRLDLEEKVKETVLKYASSLIDSIDVKGLVVDRITAMDPKGLEKLTLLVMKKELQAVIDLGALIGAVIGVVNIFL